MSLESLTTLLTAVNAMSPIGVIALLGVVILLLVHKRGPLRRLTDNHLDHVQASLDRIAESSDKQLDALNDIRADIGFVKGRLQ